MYVFLCNSRIIEYVTVKIAFDFTLYNYLTVSGTIILELHSNTCDYLCILIVKTAFIPLLSSISLDNLYLIILLFYNLPCII